MRVRRPAMLKVYPGTAYGLATTHTDQLNADLLDFLRAGGTMVSASTTSTAAARKVAATSAKAPLNMA